MRVWVQIHFLTLVLTPLAIWLFTMPSAEAAAPAKNEIVNKPATEAKPAQLVDGDGREIDEYNLIPTPPQSPMPKEATETYYYPFRQALSARFGGVLTDDKHDAVEYTLGIAYLWPRFAQPQAEVGADLLSAFGGHLNFGVKHTYFDRNYFRPYFLWGASHEVSAKDHLATITNIKNYYLRLAIGMEDTISLPKSVRLDLEARLGIDRMMLLLNLGFSWGF